MIHGQTPFGLGVVLRAANASLLNWPHVSGMLRVMGIQARIFIVALAVLANLVANGAVWLDVQRDNADKGDFMRPTEPDLAVCQANCFFEWRAVPGLARKQKMKIWPADQEVFYMAGLWGAFKDKEGADVDCYTVITTEPNEIMRPIHNRMPVVLSQQGAGQWLQGDNLDSLLKPYEGPMEAQDV